MTDTVSVIVAEHPFTIFNSSLITRYASRVSMSRATSTNIGVTWTKGDGNHQKSPRPFLPALGTIVHLLRAVILLSTPSLSIR